MRLVRVVGVVTLRSLGLRAGTCKVSGLVNAVRLRFLRVFGVALRTLLALDTQALSVTVSATVESAIREKVLWPKLGRLQPIVGYGLVRFCRWRRRNSVITLS